MEDEEAETKVWLLRWEQGEVVIWGGKGLKRKKDYFFNPCVCVCVCVCVYVLCHVWLFATPWTVAHQVLLSMGFSRQEYWSGLPCPPPGDLPEPGIKPASLTSPALAGKFFTARDTQEALSSLHSCLKSYVGRSFHFTWQVHTERVWIRIRIKWTVP